MSKSDPVARNRQWSMPDDIRQVLTDVLAPMAGNSSGIEVWMAVLRSPDCLRIANWAANQVVWLLNTQRDNNLIDDLSQQILLHVSETFYRRNPPVDWTKSPTLWLSQCLISAGFESMRKWKRYLKFRALPQIDFAIAVAGLVQSRFDEQELELKLAIRVAISKLEPREQFVIELRHFSVSTWTMEEIADAIGLKTAGGVSRILARAYRKLAELLKEMKP